MHTVNLHNLAQPPKEVFAVAAQVFLWHVETQIWELAGFEIAWGRGRRTVMDGTGEGRTHNMLVSAYMGEIVYGFSMSETGQNTALELVISGLMHLTNGL